MGRNNLDWKKLRQNKCPQCGRDLDYIVGGNFECQCTFRISEAEFKSVTMDMNNREVEKDFNKKTDGFLEGYGIE